MEENIKHLRAFIVRYLGPTNTRGSRVKITDKRNDRHKTIPYRYTTDSALETAIEYLGERGFNVVAYGDIGNANVVLCDNWGNEFIKL